MLVVQAEDEAGRGTTFEGEVEKAIEEKEEKVNELLDNTDM